MKNDPDVLILGGGPAGISAMLWCHSLGMRAILLEREPQLGGQMLMMHHQIPDYPGLPMLTGIEMRDRFEEHLRAVGAEWITGCQSGQIDLDRRSLLVNGRQVKAGALIIATGARKRRLDIPGEERFAARGVSFSGTRDHSLYAGLPVSVVGGGDSAVENAIILSRVCPSVTLIHRSDRFRARQSWLEEAQRTANISFVTDAEIVAIEGSDRTERIILRHLTTGTTFPLNTACVFIKIGITPNVEPFTGRLKLDEENYIIVDQQQRTSIDCVYAIGDVTRPACLSVATAVGHGAIAAKAISLARLAGR